jgi:hypothetical protein
MRGAASGRESHSNGCATRFGPCKIGNSAQARPQAKVHDQLIQDKVNYASAPVVTVVRAKN